MAKRRTIGENPLDVTVQGSALDEVIPHLGAPSGADPGRAALEQEAQEARQRLAALEAENQGLKGEVGQLKGQLERLAALEEQARSYQQRVAELEGENQGLKAELTQAREALKRAEAAKDARSPDPLGYTFVRRGH
jgi:predicted RNase H-like nuclease (RuvC/YqgF family)